MRTGSARPGAAGFTILEVMLVLAIIAVLAAVAAPRMAQSNARYRVDLAAHRIVTDIDRVQRQARAVSRTRYILFDVQADRYHLADADALENATETETVDLTDPACQVNLDKADFGGSAVLAVDGFGRPTSGGRIEMHVGSSTRVIVVDENCAKANIE